MPKVVKDLTSYRLNDLTTAKQLRKQCAFTLAEVLITLAIIGVVAALTIPSLVVQNQQRGWNTAAKVFEAKLNEALNVMNTQQVLSGYKTTEDFVDELQKHIKITKVCQNDDILSCFEDKVYWGNNEEEVDMSKIKIPANFGQKGWETNLVGLQFANGTNAVLAYNPECKQDPYNNQFSGKSCISMLYDTSAYANPNTSGKDLRNINVPKLLGKCAFEVDKTCYSTAVLIPEMSILECTGLDSLKGEPIDIPAGKEAAKLGIKQCRNYGNKDYWAGAVKECGGVDNLPTMEQLAKLANYIYGTSSITSGNTVNNIQPNSAKLAAMGLPDTDFAIFSNVEQNSYSAKIRWFKGSESSASTSVRMYTQHWTMCVVD